MEREKMLSFFTIRLLNISHKISTMRKRKSKERKKLESIQWMYQANEANEEKRMNERNK